MKIQKWTLLFLLFSLSSCQGLKLNKEAPYTCGWVLGSKKAVEKVMRPELDIYNVQPGQVLADIGASNGYRMGMLSVLTDSLTIYLEDIDTLCLNQTEIAKVRTYYSKLRGSPLTNAFHAVIGTSNSTQLPDQAIDKIIVSASFHHFSDPKGMLADLRKKLKPQGRLYIIENVVKVSGEVRKRTCGHPLQSIQDLEATFRAAGFKLEAVHSLHQDWTKMFVLHL